jgi:hypothetical protein
MGKQCCLRLAIRKTANNAYHGYHAYQPRMVVHATAHGSHGAILHV